MVNVVRILIIIMSERLVFSTSEISELKNDDIFELRQKCQIYKWPEMINSYVDNHIVT
jgi:hypothetical protein